MKKVFLAAGIIAFLIAGAVTVPSANANTTDKVVYDDPPKAEKKSSKSCADYSKSSKCCASKSASASKGECSDTKETKTASATTTTKSTTKKDSPDKK
ncbi:MAG: hypothetical protein KQI35_04980 [Bacteroidetes bacterium]|nr:hypothetical protein [Bacteroidota bacterium]